MQSVTLSSVGRNLLCSAAAVDDSVPRLLHTWSMRCMLRFCPKWLHLSEVCGKRIRRLLTCGRKWETKKRSSLRIRFSVFLPATISASSVGRSVSVPHHPCRSQSVLCRFYCRLEENVKIDKFVRGTSSAKKEILFNLNLKNSFTTRKHPQKKEKKGFIRNKGIYVRYEGVACLHVYVYVWVFAYIHTC